MANDMAKIIKTGSLVSLYSENTTSAQHPYHPLDHRQRRWADAAQNATQMPTFAR